jgi:hypothetical protein
VGKDIERVAAGTHHTLFLRRDGVVYGCGSCKTGQVGCVRACVCVCVYGRWLARGSIALLLWPPSDWRMAGCGVPCRATLAQVPGSLHRMSPDRTVPIPIKLHLPFQPSRRDRERQREARSSGSNLSTVLEGSEQQEQQQQRARSSSGGAARPSSGGGGSVASSSKSSTAAAAGPGGGGSSSLSTAEQQQQAAARSKAPVVHQLVAGGNSSIFLTRAHDEIPEVYSINLLAK